MKTRLLIFVISISIAMRINSQCLPMPHGTLLFANICDDGIVICADSRATWDKGLDSSNHKIWFAHIDSVRKIFPLGYFQVMITGVTTYKKYFIENLIIEYNKKLKPDSSIKKTFEGFKSFVKKKAEISEKEFSKTIYILAGYEKNLPTIFYSDSLTSYFYHYKGARLFSDTIGWKYHRQVYPMKCNNQYQMIENTFWQASRDEIWIGGAINMIQINPDNSITPIFGFPFRRQFKNRIDYWKAILNQEIKVTYHYSWSKEWLTAAIECGIKCDKCY